MILEIEAILIAFIPLQSSSGSPTKPPFSQRRMTMRLVGRHCTSTVPPESIGRRCQSMGSYVFHFQVVVSHSIPSIKQCSSINYTNSTTSFRKPKSALPGWELEYANETILFSLNLICRYYVKISTENCFSTANDCYLALNYLMLLNIMVHFLT